MSQNSSESFDAIVPPPPANAVSWTNPPVAPPPQVPAQFGSAAPPPVNTNRAQVDTLRAQANTNRVAAEEPLAGGLSGRTAPVVGNDLLNRFEANRPNVGTQATSGLGAPKKEGSIDAPSQTWIERFTPLSLRETPSWLISLTVHVALILILALIPISQRIGTSLSLLIGMGDQQDIGEDMSGTEFQTDSSELEGMESLSTIAEPNLSEALATDFKPTLTNSDLAIPSSLSSGLRGRTGPMKDALLRAYGGTGGTEDAVQAGLKWLARNQRADGSWSLVGPYNDGGVTENKPAATAMALLAFMGAGNTHQVGDYKANVLKGINALRKFQTTDGFFADQAVGNQRTYSHAQCTIAVCELYGMTGDTELREVAQKAVRYSEKAQGKNGGWRYLPREGGDTSVTGWYVMALISARMSGLDVDSEVLERVHAFLDTVQRLGRTTQVNPDGERYAYQSYSVATPSMTAEGMLCRLYLGWSTKDPRISSGAEFLCSQPFSTDKGRISYYYWYYATTTLHHIGGSTWKEWNEGMKSVLPRMQIDRGKEIGSWPPEEDPHEGGGGRLYATCFAIYCLESYYRHLPLSEMAPK